MSRKFVSNTRQSNHTNNSQYGNFTVRDNPQYRRTYVTNLPQVTKNKHMNSAHRRFKTSGEEYGHFWAESPRTNINDSYESRAGLMYGSPNSSRIPYAEELDEENIRQKGNYKSVRSHDGDDIHNAVQAEAMKNKRNRDHVDYLNVVPPTNPRRRSPLLPVIAKDKRNLDTTLIRGTTPLRSRPRDARDLVTPPKRAVSMGDGQALRIGGKIKGDLKLPDIKRIDLSLFTEDGSIVKITAVPVYINIIEGNQ